MINSLAGKITLWKKNLQKKTLLEKIQQSPTQPPAIDNAKITPQQTSNTNPKRKLSFPLFSTEIYQQSTKSPLLQPTPSDDQRSHHLPGRHNTSTCGGETSQ